jgi:phosphohistidine phosphatase
MAAYICRKSIDPDLVLCSPARRARETLDLLTEHLGTDLKAVYPESLYMAATATILAEVRAVDDAVGTLMVLGHNPEMAALAVNLVASGEPKDLVRLDGKFPTGALASFEFDCERWSQVAPGAGHLVGYATPKGLPKDFVPTGR